MKVNLPSNWVETEDTTIKHVFAMCFYQIETIEYYPKLKPLWYLMKPFIQNHERAHAHGIRNCLSGSKYCIMYEDNGTFMGKLKLLPFQLIGGLTFCKSCRTYLENNL